MRFPVCITEDMTNKFLIGALMVAVTAVFATVLGFDFVNWDDPWYVINNELIQSWSVSNLAGIATENVARNFAPLTIFSFLIDHTIWGLNPAGFHFTNLLLHVINVALVYLLVLQLTSSRFASFFAAGVFGLHPLQVETVAWVSSRKGLLSATFILLSLRFWLRDECNSSDEVKGILFLVIALMCKAIAVVVPGIVFLYDVLIRQKAVSESIAKQLVPGFFCIMLILQTMTAQTTIVGGVRSHIGMGKLQLLGVDLVILWKYVAMTIFPHDLCMLYNQPVDGIWVQIVAALAGWMAVGFLLYRLRDRTPSLVFACLCWFALLVPVLNLFPITTLMNDRYLYLPMIPFAAIVGIGIERVATRLPSPASMRRVSQRLACGVAGIVCLALLAGETTRYLPVWKNGLALWAHAREHAPELTVVQIQWANTLQREGNTEQAVAVLKQALAQTQPDKQDRQRMIQKIESWSNMPAEQSENTDRS